MNAVSPKFSHRTKVFHDVLLEMVRAEKIYGNAYENGTRPQLRRLLRDVRVMVTAREATNSVTWADVLAEEFLEAMVEREGPKLRNELIQVAAVAVRWAEALDKKEERE